MCPATFIFCAKRGEIRMIKPAEFVSYVDSLPKECIEIRMEDHIIPTCISTDFRRYRGFQMLRSDMFTYNRRR